MKIYLIKIILRCVILVPIPKEIKPEHVIKAIEEIDLNGYEKKHESTGFDLIYKNKQYPPKHVLQLASLIATGKKIRKLSGGDPTNNALIELGFFIVLKDTTYEIGKDYVREKRIKNNESELSLVDENELLFIEEKEIEITEREQIIKSRIGHTSYKQGLLKVHGKCLLCGLTDERFLVASHIKPWSKANNYERLDINNGLLLCPNHDSLFDKGYISFSEDGTILISSSINGITMQFLNINETIKIKLNEHQNKYIKWHLENIYNG